MKDKGFYVFLGIAGIIGIGLAAWAATRKTEPATYHRPGNQDWQLEADGLAGVLYENEKRVELVRGPDGHVLELIIHHTIKQNALGKIPEGILEM